MKKLNSSLSIFFLLIFFSSVSFAQVDCGNNAGFETGDVTGWICKSGSYGSTVWSGDCPNFSAGTCPAFPIITPTTGILNTNGINAPLNTGVDRHTIMTMAYDAGGPLGYDSISGYTVPVVPPTNGGTYSFRLGDAFAGGIGPNGDRLARAEAIRLSFLVTPSNAGFTYQYAVFVQDPSHLAEEQPRFEVTVYDSVDNIIPCGFARYVPGGTNPFCSANASAFKKGGSDSTWRYTDWVPVGLDLSGFIGHPVSIEFKTTDCFPQQNLLYSSGGVTTTCYSDIGTGGKAVCCFGSPSVCTTVSACSTHAPGTHSSYAYINTYCAPIAAFNAPVCTGADSVLISAPTGYKNYRWSCSSDTLDKVWIHFPKPGDSCVVNMNSSLGCPTKTTIKLTGTDVITRDTAFCPGTAGTVTLKDSLTSPGNYTFQWTGPDAYSSALQNPVIPIPSVTQTYTVSVNDTSAHCVYVKTMTINILPKPVPDLSDPVTICSGGSTTLTAYGGSPGLTYSWYANSALVSNATSFSVSPTATTTYKAVIGNVAGCMDSASVIVTVDLAVGLQLSPDVAICNSGCTQLTASGAPNINWQPGNINAASINACPTGTTTYTVTGTGGTCTDVKTVMVTINTAPPVNASPDTAICIGSTRQLNAAGPDCVWSPAASLSNGLSCNPIAAPTGTTTYTVVITDANNCTNSGTSTVTVNSLPVIASGAQPPSICIGSPATVTVTGGMAQYLWLGGPTPTGSSTATVTPSSSGIQTYTVAVVDDNGCPNATTVNVTVNDLPIATAAPNTSVCLNTSVQLTATGGGNTIGPYSYTWSPNTGLSNTNQDTTTATPSSSQTYTVLVTDGNSCTGNASATVNINLSPAVNASPDTAICIGATRQLNAAGPGCVWNPGIYLDNPGICNPTSTPTQTTTYTITVTDVNNCTNSGVTTITVNLLPAVTISAPAAICTGDQTQLSAGGGSTYAWLPNDVNQANSQNPTASPTQTTTYTVRVTTAQGCVDTASTTITVNPLPVVTVSPDTSLCVNDNTTLTASGGSTYAWTPTGGLNTPGNSSTVAQPSTTTHYTVTVTNGLNCTNTGTVTVSIYPAPVACDGAPVDICLNESAQIDVSCSNGLTYAWEPDPTISPLNSPTPIASPTVTTTYTFVVSTGNCPSDTGTVTVTVHSIPSVTASPDTTIIAGTSAQLTSVASGVVIWSPVTGLDCVPCPNPLANPITTTMYIVTTVDSYGCRNSDTVIVNVEDILTLYLPNAFSPVNYNDKNNVFYAYGIGIWQFELYIFDRWGALIFQTNDPLIGWDGTYKGQLVQGGVYGYLVKAKSITGKTITKTGPVTIVR